MVDVDGVSRVVDADGVAHEDGVVSGAQGQGNNEAVNGE